MSEPSLPRGLGSLLKDSFALVKQDAGPIAAVVALGLLPDALLTGWALTASGLTDAETVSQVLAGEHLGRLAPVAAARAAGELAVFLATLTILLILDARDRKAPLALPKAFAATAELFWPYFATMARAFVLIAAGLLLFVAPGLLLAYLFVFSGAAVVVDGLSGRHALAKSRKLASSRPATVAFYLAVALLAAAAAAFAASWLLGLAVRLAQGPSGSPPGLLQWQLRGYLQRCLSGVAGAWVAAFTLLLYKDLEASAAAV